MKYFPLVIVLLIFFPLNAQIAPKAEHRPKDSLERDSLRFNRDLLKQKKPSKAKSITVKDYKLISFSRDTTSIDTTLSIAKEYKYNYLRRDDFELMPFSNVGQPYNSLGKDFDNFSLYPTM